MRDWRGRFCGADGHRRACVGYGVALFSRGGEEAEVVGVQALCWQSLAAGCGTHFLIRELHQSPDA
jgi:hypothetical protein